MQQAMNQDLENVAIPVEHGQHGPFNMTAFGGNKWQVSCEVDYQIVMSESMDLESAVSTHPIEKQHEAVLHKKADGVSYRVDEDIHYLIFYPGFPNGGESGADIHAPWGTCFSDIPTDGAVILEVVFAGHAPVEAPTSVDNIAEAPTSVDNIAEAPTSVDNIAEAPTSVDNAVSINVEEGDALAAKWLATAQECVNRCSFTETSFHPMLHEMLADTFSWDGGFFGLATGSMNSTKDEFIRALGEESVFGTKYTPSNVFTVTDTLRGIICTTFDIHLEVGPDSEWRQMDGDEVVPHELKVHEGRNMLEIAVNHEHKIISLRTVSSLDKARLLAANAAVQQAICDAYTRAYE